MCQNELVAINIGNESLLNRQPLNKMVFSLQDIAIGVAKFPPPSPVKKLCYNKILPVRQFGMLSLLKSEEY